MYSQVCVDTALTHWRQQWCAACFQFRLDCCGMDTENRYLHWGTVVCGCVDLQHLFLFALGICGTASVSQTNCLYRMRCSPVVLWLLSVLVLPALVMFNFLIDGTLWWVACMSVWSLSSLCVMALHVLPMCGFDDHLPCYLMFAGPRCCYVYCLLLVLSLPILPLIINWGPAMLYPSLWAGLPFGCSAKLSNSV